MAKTKKTAAAAAKPEVKTAPVAKTEEKKAAPAVKVEEVKAAPAAKTEVKAAPAVKAEEKKPAAKKEAAAKTESKKPAAKKAATAKAEAKKPAAKKAATAKTEAKKPAAKRAPKKKEITVDDVVAKLTKKLDAKKAASIDGKVAADIKLYGSFEAHMYIEVKDGKLTVAPYDYIEKDIEAAISVENAIAVAEGKLTIADALADGRLYAFGNIGAAAKLAKLF